MHSRSNRVRNLLYSLSGLWMLSPAAVALAAAPTVQINFTPAAIQTGTVSRLTITLGNSNTDDAVLSAALTDSLPAGLSIATPSGLGGSCAAGSLVGAAGG